MGSAVKYSPSVGDGPTGRKAEIPTDRPRNFFRGRDGNGLCRSEHATSPPKKPPLPRRRSRPSPLRTSRNSGPMACRRTPRALRTGSFTQSTSKIAIKRLVWRRPLPRQSWKRAARLRRTGRWLTACGPNRCQKQKCADCLNWTGERLMSLPRPAAYDGWASTVSYGKSASMQRRWTPSGANVLNANY